MVFDAAGRTVGRIEVPVMVSRGAGVRRGLAEEMLSSMGPYPARPFGTGRADGGPGAVELPGDGRVGYAAGCADLVAGPSADQVRGGYSAEEKRAV